MAESKTQRGEPWYAGVDRPRRRVLYATFAGWTFDGYETQALVVVVAPALTQLLPPGERGAIGFYSGLAIGLTGVPPTFRIADPIRSGPKWRIINAREASEVHSRVQV